MSDSFNSTSHRCSYAQVRRSYYREGRILIGYDANNHGKSHARNIIKTAIRNKIIQKGKQNDVITEYRKRKLSLAGHIAKFTDNS